MNGRGETPRPAHRLPCATVVLGATALALALAACGDSEVQTPFEVVLQRGLPPTTRVTDVEVRRGGCDADAEVVARFDPAAGGGMAASLPPGTYGFVVIARDEDCAVQIDECAVVSLPLAEGRSLSLRPSRSGAHPACGVGEVCESYRCVPGAPPPPRDAGPRPRDLGPPPPPPDLGPPETDSGPPPDPCDGRTDCLWCLDDPACGWCATDERCHTGDATGPASGACADWQTRVFACVAEMDAGPADTGPRDSGPIDSGPRDSGPRDSGPRDSGPIDSGPSCDGAYDCSSCAARPGCGWCVSSGSCVPGNTAGPAVGACSRWAGSVGACTPASLCPAGPCNLELQTGCGAGQACDFGGTPPQPTCRAAGAGGEGASCAAAGDCAAGFRCVWDGPTPLCRRLCCSNTAVCPGSQYCLPAAYADGAGGDLFGGYVCNGPDGCDPVANTGCGSRACYPVRFLPGLVWNECLPPGTVPVGAACAAAESCVPGAACVNNPDPFCRRLCTPGDACAAGESCVALSEPGLFACLPG